MSRSVLGYHGTSRAAAELILGGQPFRLSRNAYDWLGDGVYFWEYGPRRAYEWARATYGVEAVVLRARIHLAGCLDLTDLGAPNELKKAFLGFMEMSRAMGLRVPRQSQGFRGLDREVINFFAGPEVRVVRAAFVEGEPLWDKSGLWDKTHIQVAVRDVSLISKIRIVEDVEREKF